MPRTLRPGQRAQLFVVDVDSGERRLVHESATLLFEAPNWTADGQWLVVNGDGLLFRLRSDGSGEPEQIDLGTVPAINKPIPMRPKNQSLADDSDDLARIVDVARTLRVSKRFVQTLVRRKAIPVIKLGRRCTRFNLDDVLAAVRKFEVQEMGR